MRIVLSVLFSLCLTLPGVSQVRIDNLESLLDYADKHAPAAQQAKLQPLIAQDDKKLVASGLYPKVNAFATGDYYPLIQTLVVPAEFFGGAPGSFIKARLGLPYVFTAGAELSIPVVNLEKWTQLSKARAQQEQAVWSSKAALENFHVQLTTAYYMALVTREVLRLNDENVQTADELLRIMSERNKTGIVNPSDYNRTGNLQLDVKTAGIGYNRTLEQHINNLKAMLNIKDDSLVFTESLTGFEWPVLTSGPDAVNRPAWQEVNLKVKVAELALSESRKGGLPRLSLNSRYTYNMQSELKSGSQNVEFDVANIGLRLDIPIFSGNYYRTLIHKNKLQLKWTQLEKERVEATLNQQNDDWYRQYKSAYDKHGILDEKVKAASDNLRIANLNIQEGVMEFDEYNNIFMEYNRARIEYLQNLTDGVLYYLLSTQNF